MTEALAASLTIGETYFFREPQVFGAIENAILPEIVSRRKEEERFLRIWVAGCSTGEEAYSLAIILSRVIPDIDTWSITLLATDINPLALKKAESGIYGEWSFRSSTPAFRDRYFRKRDDGRYEIRHEIRELVTFSFLNLVEDAYPSLLTNTNAMDIILCRNVLMYFSRDTARATLEKIQHSLVPGGRFIASVTESSLATNPFLVPENCAGITIYRKTDTRQSSEGAAVTGVPGTGSIPAQDFPHLPVRGEPGFATTGPAEEAEHPGRSPSFPEEPVTAPEYEGKDPYNAARALFESGNYAGAERFLGPHIAQNPDDPRILALMAEVLANRGDLAGAAVWCSRAIERDRLNPLYHHLLATIRQEEGATDVAIGELRRALYADPSCILAYFTLATLKRQQGNLTEAAIYFQNALAYLSKRHPDEIIEGAGGMSAGRLQCIIRSITGSEVPA